MGIRLVAPFPPGFVGREVMGQEPSSRCVLIRNSLPRLTTRSLGFIPALASAYRAWPVAQASLAISFVWLQPPSRFWRFLIPRIKGFHSLFGLPDLDQRVRRMARD